MSKFTQRYTPDRVLIVAIMLTVAVVACTIGEVPPDDRTPAVPTDSLTTTAAATSTERPTAIPTVTLTPAPTLAARTVSADSGETLTVWRTFSLPRAAYSIALSPTGGRSAVGLINGDIVVFDVEAGLELVTFERHDNRVHDLEFTPDGTRLISGSADRTVQIWDMETLERYTGARTTPEVLSVAVSPDGARFSAAGMYSALADVWRVGDLSLLMTLSGHETRLRAVAYSPDGRYLATGDEGGTVLVRDSHSGDVLYSISVNGGAISLAFSPIYPHLAIGTDRAAVVVRDLDSGELVATWLAHGGPVWELEYSPDGGVLFSSGGDTLVGLWDGTSYDRLRYLRGFNADVRGLSVARDGSLLGASSTDGTALIWAP